MMFLVLLLCTLVALSGANSAPQVVTKDGTVIGNDLNGKVYSWLGIPFSAPPSGSLRWMPPVKSSGWLKTPLHATKPKLCRQKSGGNWIGDENQCNNVNIWKPANAPIGKNYLPVMVWIHGGSFTTAAPAVDVYNGTQLVEASLNNNQPVIVVSIQYRLAGLGFMGHPKLSQEFGAHDSSGNYGILDQIMALQWIQENIGAFGGDKSRVTIFGESAGAYSVCTLLASPLATGLFAGAIAESAYCANVYLPSQYAENAGLYCSKLNECGSDASADVAMECTTSNYAAASLNDGGMGKPGLLAVMPNIDGYVLTDTPLNSIRKGKSADGTQDLPNVPVIIGSNSEEMNAFAIDSIQMTPSDASTIGSMYTESAFVTLTKALQTEVGLLCAPPENSANYCPVQTKITNYFRRILAIVTDMYFTSTANSITSGLNSIGVPAYRYLFHQAANGTQLRPLGPFHSLDVPFIFGTFNLYQPGWKPNSALNDLSSLMQQYWINFAYYGNPNGNPDTSGGGGPKLPSWPTAGKDGDEYIQFQSSESSGDTTTKANGFRQQQVDFWWTRVVNEQSPLSPESDGQKKKAGGASFLVVIILLFLAAFALGFFFYKRHQGREKAEALKVASKAAFPTSKESNPYPVHTNPVHSSL
eukprot:GSChrysophyteH1.ASY1.ANO1.2510.1 assembled CDS